MSVRWVAPVALAAPVLLAGCNAFAHDSASAPAASLDVSTRQGAAAVPRVERPLQVIAPRERYLVIESPRSDGAYTLELAGVRGAVVASTVIPTAAVWTPVAGPSGAYWLDGDSVRLLTPAGATRVIGTVPSGVDGFVVSPFGDAFAYATTTVMSTSNQTTDNRIVVQQIGGTSRAVADQVDDWSSPSADAPQAWTYGLMSWTDQGIVFRREVTGACGCAAFDMQMLSAYTGLVDPASGATTDLTSAQDCPLSGYGVSVAACFHVTGTGAADELRVTTTDAASRHFTMSGLNDGGDAVLSGDGRTVAYETVPTADSGCGSAVYPTTLHVLDLTRGQATEAAIEGLTIKVWPYQGPILGEVSGGSGSSIVSIDPTTLAADTVWTGALGSRLIGLS